MAIAAVLLVVGVIYAVNRGKLTPEQYAAAQATSEDQQSSAAAATASAAAASASAAAGCSVADPHLSRTASAVASDPAAVRLAFVGDSTRDEQLAARGLYERMRGFQTSDAGGLTGVDPTNIRSFGANGSPITSYQIDQTRLTELAQFDPTMIELSIGINDLRENPTAGPEFQQNLADFVTQLHTSMPNADILLSVPGALSTIDAGQHYVTSADGAINPDGAAQEVTTALHQAYTAVAASLDYVALNDVQQKVTGTDADPNNPPRYLDDQLHPTPQTAGWVADTIVNMITGECFARQ